MRSRIGMAVFGAVAAATLATVGTVAADHAGETATLSKAEGVTDGETITVNFAGMLKPGETTVLAIMANTFPVVGPDAFNLAEFDPSKTYPVNPDGTGSIEFVATIDHDTFNCLEIQCYIVVFQGIGNDSYTAGAPISFATEAPVTDPPATDPPATDPPATDPPATTGETTPAVIATSPVTEPAETSGAEVDAEEEDGGGSGGLIIGIIAAIAVIGGGAALWAKSKKSKK